ncbi:MAG: MaoC/PaaZ C-terminal domain-containing protein [Porticoccaceae bacterium]
MMYKHTCFEDFQAGQSGITGPRSVGEAEIVAFASITGDYNFLHVTTHEAAKTFYGGRIAHGLLGCSMAVGMLSLDAPHTIGRNVPDSYLSGFRINYRAALKSGDTVRVEWQIGQCHDNDASVNYGTVETTFRVITQNGDAIYDGAFLLNVKRRGASDAAIYDTSAQTLWQPREVAWDENSLFTIDDYVVGAGGITCGRTISEADVVNFAGLTADQSPIYVDEVFASKTRFGGRIVPAMFVFDLSLGFWARDGWITRVKTDKGAQDIGHLGDNARFLKPVRIGDTVRCIYMIKDVRSSKSNPNRRIVTYGFQVINQRDEVVQDGEVLVIKGDVGR